MRHVLGTKRDRTPLLLALALLALLLGLALLMRNAWFWHPLGQCPGDVAEQTRCKSYNLHSGLGANLADVSLFVSVALGALHTYRKHTECHEDGCSRRGRYVIDGGVRCCDLHHPALDERAPEDRGHVHRLHVAHLAHLDKLRL